MGFLPYEKEVHEAAAFIAHAESFLKFAILALVFMIMLQLLILLLAALLLAATVSPRVKLILRDYTSQLVALYQAVEDQEPSDEKDVIKQPVEKDVMVEQPQSRSPSHKSEDTTPSVPPNHFGNNHEADNRIRSRSKFLG
ncbi:hypothetical protein B0O99DRAFT_742531 [Bisporella sp. PMI_857]|nr:hypothetical protein B0O99DRAFT_742531 [Bisporella sp. PMI_857]